MPLSKEEWRELFQFWIREDPVSEEDFDYFYGLNIPAFQKSLIYTAREDGRIIGYVRCIKDSDFALFVRDIEIEEDYQGLGIAENILEAIREDYCELELYYLSFNRDEDMYYKSLGLNKTGNIYK